MSRLVVELDICDSGRKRARAAASGNLLRPHLKRTSRPASCRQAKDPRLGSNLTDLGKVLERLAALTAWVIPDECGILMNSCLCIHGR